MRKFIPALNTLALLLAFVYIAAYLAYAYKNPDHEWDMLGYIGSAITLKSDNVQKIHQKTYSAVAQGTKKDDYFNLTHDVQEDERGPRDYRHTMAHDPELFHQQLRYYKIRPLFLWLMNGLHASGISYVKALAWLQIIPIGLLGLMVLYWLNRYYQGWYAAILTILLFSSLGVLRIAKGVTPDALNAFLVFLSVYLLIEKKLIHLACTILIVSLLVRTNNLIFVGLTLTFLFISHQKQGNGLNLKQWLAYCLASVAVYLSLNRWADNLGWWTVFHVTFLESNNAPVDQQPAFSLASYLKVVIKAIPETLAWHQEFVTFILLCFMMLISKPLKALSEDRHALMVLVIFISSIIHFLLFPAAWNRFFIGYYLCVAMLFFVQMSILLPSSVARRSLPAHE